MKSSNHSLARRDFLRSAGAMGTALGIGVPSRVLGANDKIRIGTIGVGGRGTHVSRRFAEIGEETGLCEMAAVCDVYQKRVTQNKERLHCDGYLDYRQLLARDDIDVVYIATPDHWHATMAIEAMKAGKDVYLEKPMCHTIEEAKKLVDTVKETGRVLQVGSQTTSADQWYKAKKAIADGMIGEMIMSQGSYHRNSRNGEWNWPIDPEAGPAGSGEEHIDWEMWLGPAPERPYDPDRYFRFRKYWDYSGGIATDLFYHVVAPLNICWDEPQFPYKVMAGGGIYVFHDREVPDTFHLIGEYKKGHSLVLSSSMANSQHIPGTIRGHLGTVIMVEHGQFERYSPYITVRPESAGRGNRRVIGESYAEKWGTVDIQIPVKKGDMVRDHILNFLECVHTRKKPHLDVETGAKAQVLITMAVESYRQGKILYFDEANWKVLDHPVKA
ncbi:MAG: Gfo/Idh/MocA family oxidoreductase [Planctomycetes bacterium]|nr:Gfo/Idh/MocA family oxidoreductase [Planctomycetota bacterium]